MWYNKKIKNWRIKMGVIVNKENDKENELTRRIDADLNSKLNSKSKVVESGEEPDFVEDQDYTKDLKKTGEYGWVWILLIVLIVVIGIILGVSVKSGN